MRLRASSTNSDSAKGDEMEQAKVEQPMFNRQTMRQRGVIKCGGGLDKRFWTERAKAEGYCTLDCGAYVELWSLSGERP